MCAHAIPPACTILNADESRSALMTKTQQRALRALANVRDRPDGLPLNWQVGTALVQCGWAAPGSRYPLYRITAAGRQALAKELGASVPNN